MKTYIKQIGFFVLGLHVFSSSYSQEQHSVIMMKDALVMKTEGVCFLGTGLNEDDAKTFAINDAKRNALEQAGTYLESHTIVLNYQLVKDEVITFSAGLLKVKVLKEERALINNMFVFRVNIIATIDTKLLEQRIAEIRNDSKLRKQLEAERERVKQLETRITELQIAGNTVTKHEVRNTINQLSAIDWFEKGILAEDMNQKIEYYSKAIELDPNYASAYMGRGVAYYKLGNYETAIRDYSKAIELDPNYASAYFNRGLAYYNLGNYETAIRDHSKAIDLDPNFASAYMGRGVAYYNLGNLETAIRDYSKAIELDPNFASAYMGRGVVYYKLGNYETAIRDYSKAIELDPNYASAYFNRGLAYYNLGNYETAIRDYSKAIELDPNYASAYNGRGAVYYKLGNYETAIRDYSKAIELDPNYASTYKNRGNAYNKLHNTNEEVADYNRYLRINGNKSGDAEKVRQWIKNLGHIPQY